MKNLLLVEPLLENYTTLPAAIQAGAKRVALADNLSVGGTTVSKGTMAEATRYAHEHQVSLDLLIAPRGGVTPYNDVELKIMEADLLEAQQLGVDGVIVGALTAQRQLDQEALRPLVAAAGGMSLTLSTAFDQIRPQDRGAAIDWLGVQGFDRILSVGAATDRLADWTATQRLAASAGIALVPTNVPADQVASVAEKLGVHEFLGTQTLAK